MRAPPQLRATQSSSPGMPGEAGGQPARAPCALGAGGPGRRCPRPARVPRAGTAEKPWNRGWRRSDQQRGRHVRRSLCPDARHLCDLDSRCHAAHGVAEGPLRPRARSRARHGRGSSLRCDPRACRRRIPSTARGPGRCVRQRRLRRRSPRESVSRSRAPLTTGCADPSGFTWDQDVTAEPSPLSVSSRQTAKPASPGP